MKTKMTENWKPDEKYFYQNLADTHAMTNFGESRTWCEHNLYEFKMYWCADMGGCGKIMANWNLTFWNRCKTLWEQVDKSRHYRKEVEKQATPIRKEMIPIIKPTQEISRTEIADMLAGIKL